MNKNNIGKIAKLLQEVNVLWHDEGSGIAEGLDLNPTRRNAEIFAQYMFTYNLIRAVIDNLTAYAQMVYNHNRQEKKQ